MKKATPFDGAILRALRLQAKLKSTQLAAELTHESGHKVLAPHLSGYESGARAVPDWLVESGCRVLAFHLGAEVSPLLFPGYAARQFNEACVLDEVECGIFLSKIGAFRNARHLLISQGKRETAKSYVEVRNG